MLQDIRTVWWKEWREYLAGPGGGRFGNLRVLAIIVIAGAFIAFSAGAGWATSPLALLATGVYFPLVLTLTMVADSFAGERERHERAHADPERDDTDQGEHAILQQRPGGMSEIASD